MIRRCLHNLSLLRLLSLLAATTALIAACKKPPDDSVVRPAEPVATPAPAPPAIPESLPAPAASSPPPLSQSTDFPAGSAVPATRGLRPQSDATTPRAYRKDGAAHLYRLNAERIYIGRLPPHLYAIGVISVELDRTGRIVRLKWLRAPRHAPEVVAAIERTIRKAAPFPAPAQLGKVVYTDTWLWHKSGKFQLDTLTEGQE